MGTPKKVAILTNYPLDATRISSGIATVAYHLVAGLRQYDDLDIHVIHCHSEIPHSRTLVDGNLTVCYLSEPRRRVVPSEVAGLNRVVRILRQLKPDVVNAHTGAYAVAGLRAGFPTIYTVHSLAYKHHKQMAIVRSAFDRLGLLLDARLERCAVRGVQDIIAVSSSVITEYRRFSDAVFHRIENPVSEDFFAVTSGEKPGRLIYLGVVSEEKGVLTLLKALKVAVQSIPSAHLHIAGQIRDEKYYRVLVDYVHANGLEEKVRFLGLLDKAAVLREYAECEMLVLPSRQENSPMVIREAMAAGKPVIATRVGGIGDLVRDGKTGFVIDVDDVESLADRMVELLRRPDLRAGMGKMARLEAASRFRLDQVAERYRVVYLAVAERSRPVAENLTIDAGRSTLVGANQ